VQMGHIIIASAVVLLWKMIEHRKKALRLFIFCSISFFIGLLPWFLTFLKDWSNLRSFKKAFIEAFFGKFQGIMLEGTLWHGIRELFYLIFKQTPGLYLICILAGIYFIIRRWKFSAESVGLLIAFGLNTWFFMFYNTWDRFAFLLPSFIMLIYCGTFGVDRIVNVLKSVYKKNKLAIDSNTAGSRWAGFFTKGIYIAALLLFVLSVLFPIYFYSNLSVWGNNPDSVWYRRYNNNHTINSHRVNEYIANPNKMNYTDVEEYANLLFWLLPVNSIYIDDDGRNFYPLNYYFQKYYKKRKDVSIVLINSWGLSGWGADRNVFSKLIRKAYLDNRNLFLASVGHPYSDFLREASQKKKYKFKRYNLDSKHWIYKLITIGEGENTESPLSGEFGIKISQAGGKADILKENVLFFKSAELIDQNMGGFGPYWENANQLFVAFSNISGLIEFLITSEKEMNFDLHVGLTTANDFGIIEFFLNKKKIIKNIDLFTKNVYIKKITAEGIKFNKGDNRLIIKVAGKNEKSSDMRMGLDYIEFIPSNM
jgi:hypothetical protein